MSCAVRIVVVSPGAMSAVQALDEVTRLERRWSRFLPDSELSRLNAASGRAVHVSPETHRLVTSLVEAWHVTDGAFDPTLLVPLVGLGYASSRDDVVRRTSLPEGLPVRGRPDQVLVDPVHSSVTLPARTVLDAGGLGKGLAADMVVEGLVAAGAAGALVSIGGDLRVAGDAPDDDAWTVSVETAPGAEPELVRLRDGGVATSSTRLRTWTDGSASHHHLLDPESGRPTDGEVIGASVVAGTARWAEALTKPAFVRGLDEWTNLLDRHDAAGRAVTADGERVHSPRWGRYGAAVAAGATP